MLYSRLLHHAYVGYGIIVWQLQPGFRLDSASCLSAAASSTVLMISIAYATVAQHATSAEKTWEQGWQAPLGDFDQLLEGPWPISTSRPSGGLWGRASALWRVNWTKCPPVSSTKIRSAGRRPFRNIRNFRPSAREFRPFDELASPAWEA
jgi:hypothetical protein